MQMKLSLDTKDRETLTETTTVLCATSKGGIFTLNFHLFCVQLVVYIVGKNTIEKAKLLHVSVEKGVQFSANPLSQFHPCKTHLSCDFYTGNFHTH